MKPEQAHFHVLCERESDSTPASLWKVLSQIEEWPQWVPGVQSARLDGALLPGSGFRWRAGGIDIRSTFVVVERRRKLAWTGKTLGLSVRHEWTIEERADGAQVVSEEWVRTIWPFRGWIERSVRESVERWIDALVRRAGQEVPCD